MNLVPFLKPPDIPPYLREVSPLPERICEVAKSAGMRYVNLTTRHHDGFYLWDTWWSSK